MLHLLSKLSTRNPYCVVHFDSMRAAAAPCDWIYQGACGVNTAKFHPQHSDNCRKMTCALPMQPEIDYNKVLVVHNASSCTHPANYYHLMKTIVYPYWNADPPQHRLSKKNYKKVDHPTAFVPEDSLKFKVRHAGRHL